MSSHRQRSSEVEVDGWQPLLLTRIALTMNKRAEVDQAATVMASRRAGAMGDIDEGWNDVWDLEGLSW